MFTNPYLFLSLSLTLLSCAHALLSFIFPSSVSTVLQSNNLVSLFFFLQFLASSQFSDAASHFSSALELDPKFWFASMGRGEAHMMLGDVLGAMKDLEAAQGFFSFEKRCPVCACSIDLFDSSRQNLHPNTLSDGDCMNCWELCIRCFSGTNLGLWPSPSPLEPSLLILFVSFALLVLLRLSEKCSPTSSLIQEVRFLRGRLLARMARHAEAVADFSMVLDEEPKNDDVLVSRGR